MAEIKEVYLEMANKSVAITEETFTADNSLLIASNHAYLSDYTRWLEVLSERPEVIMIKGALREYQMSMLANTLGLYNLSFTGLRFFFERTLTSILFSSKEIDLRLWMKGNRDTYWAEICDDDKGIFSHNFSNAFCPELKEEIKHYKALAKAVYRECSEYVHGNISTQERVPANLEYSEPLVKEWNAKADTIKDIILFSFCLRYLNHLNSTQKQLIEASTLEHLSHIQYIRSSFSITI